jgi:hypothetical protein
VGQGTRIGKTVLSAVLAVFVAGAAHADSRFLTGEPAPLAARAHLDVTIVIPAVASLALAGTSLRAPVNAPVPVLSGGRSTMHDPLPASVRFATNTGTVVTQVRVDTANAAALAGEARNPDRAAASVADPLTRSRVLYLLAMP